jgi:hypothetical protein
MMCSTTDGYAGAPRALRLVHSYLARPARPAPAISRPSDSLGWRASALPIGDFEIDASSWSTKVRCASVTHWAKSKTWRPSSLRHPRSEK